VRLSPRGKIFCRGDEHPDRQLARIIAVPQQLGTHHRTVRKQAFDPTVEDTCDLFHAWSTARTTSKVPAGRQTAGPFDRPARISTERADRLPARSSGHTSAGRAERRQCAPRL